MLSMASLKRQYDVELFLRTLPIFRRLSASDRQHLASFATVQHVERADVLFHEGRPCDSVWVVMEGRFHLLRHHPEGRTQAYCVMTPGEMFCCLPILDRGVYPATAVAATPGKVVRIPLEMFRSFMDRQPALLQETLCVLSGRLREVEAKGCLMHDSVERRIAQTLLALRNKFGDTIPLTRREIAELAVTTLETAIRTIVQFQQAGWVRSSRSKIEILKPESLKALLP
jgi:CRP-like cAMP-binding protein